MSSLHIFIVVRIKRLTIHQYLFRSVNVENFFYFDTDREYGKTHTDNSKSSIDVRTFKNELIKLHYLSFVDVLKVRNSKMYKACLELLADLF